MSRWNIGAIILMLFAAVVHSVPLTKNNNNNSNNTKDDLTTDYAKAIIRRTKTAEIINMLNTDINPCDDFYNYACGNWPRHNPAQLFENLMTDSFQAIAKAFDRRLHQTLQAKSSPDQLVTKVQHFFQACKLAHRDDVHYKLALENVYKEFGEFPLLLGADWQDNDFNWWQLIAKIQHKYGKQIILAVDIMGDIKNNTENRAYIGAPEYQSLTGSKILNALDVASTVANIQKYFGVDKQLAEQTVKEWTEFEQQLIKSGSDSRDKGLQDLLEQKTVAELNDEYKEHLDFAQFLQLVLGVPSADELPEYVYLYDIHYLNDMFRVVARTPKRTVANYIIWQLLEQYLVEPKNADEMPKWCIEMTKKYFGKYIDHFVYAGYKSAETEADVYQVWDEIRNTFRDQLRGDKFDWISNATRTKAIEKLDAMELSINSYDDENFDELYANLTVDRTNYVRNVQQIQQLERHVVLQHLHGPPLPLNAAEILSFSPAYNLLANNIKIPVAILQPHYFWDANFPHALKYSTLGYLIAHEMVHGFDDEGRNYDKLGNSKMWWDEKSTYEYDERRKCFQAQYHNYKYGGSKLPESVLQSENIADNAGIKIAYAAYIRWLAKQQITNPEIEQQETLSQLSLTNRQLFFTGFAQVWCEDVQKLFRRTVANEDNHAPGMYRVIGSLSNFQEFSWVFGCKRDAPMDPEFKCAIF